MPTVNGDAALVGLGTLTVDGRVDPFSLTAPLVALADLTVDAAQEFITGAPLAAISTLTATAEIPAPTQMPMAETLFIDGTDIRSVVSCIQVIDGMFQTPDPRGDNPIIPGLSGELHVEKPVTTGVVSYGLVFEGENHDLPSLNQRYLDLKQLVKPGRTVQLKRRISFSTGTEDHTCTGEYLSGLDPSITINRSAKLALAMRVLEGVWFGPSVTVTSPAAITVAGEADTHRITIQMTAGTLTNTTTGDSLTYTGPGLGTIDCEKFTANESGTDTSGYLVWTKAYPMTLAPGSNTLTGSATITYSPAYY